MKPRGKMEHDLELNKDVFVDFKVGSDKLGNPILTEISIGFIGEKVPQGGLTTSMLRDIKVSELLISWFQDNPRSFLSKSDEKYLWIVLSKTWKAHGSKGVLLECYASLAYFYIKTLETNPNNPTATLAKQLKLPVKTLQTRLAQTRKLGLLNTSATGSGKASGSMTLKARKIVKEMIK